MRKLPRSKLTLVIPRTASNKHQQTLIQIFELKIKDEIDKLWQSDTTAYAIEDEKLSLVAEDETNTK
jgi:hypothetical protein